jgi:hypothetical protein
MTHLRGLGPPRLDTSGASSPVTPASPDSPSSVRHRAPADLRLARLVDDAVAQAAGARGGRRESPMMRRSGSRRFDTEDSLQEGVLGRSHTAAAAAQRSRRVRSELPPAGAHSSPALAPVHRVHPAAALRPGAAAGTARAGVASPQPLCSECRVRAGAGVVPRGHAGRPGERHGVAFGADGGRSGRGGAECARPVSGP